MHAPVRDVSCCYEVVGTVGPPVLLVMGFGMTGRAWAPIVDRLSIDHRVCWYDMRGIGESTPGETARHTLPDLADDAAALLDHLGWGDAHVAGISMGGMIAQHLALRHRERLRSLTLIATHAGGRLESMPSPQAMKLFLTSNLTKGEQRLHAIKALLVPPEVEIGRDVAIDQGELAAWVAPSDPKIRALHLGAILRHDTRAELRKLAGLPTLVLRPDRDVLIPPRCSDRLAARIPGATLVGFPDGGHGLIAQHPDRVSDVMRAHVGLAETAARRQSA